jgi:hypothetical protein
MNLPSFTKQGFYKFGNPMERRARRAAECTQARRKSVSSGNLIHSHPQTIADAAPLLSSLNLGACQTFLGESNGIADRVHNF